MLNNFENITTLLEFPLDSTFHEKRQDQDAKFTKIPRYEKHIFRNLLIAIDASEFSAELDYTPSRLGCSLKLTTEFVTGFLEENILSQCAILICQDGNARVFSPFQSN